MTTITSADTPLEQLVTANPALAAVFDRLGLDFCCHGSDSLAAACEAAGVAVADARAAIESATGADPEEARWTGLGPADLAAHIAAVHHAYLYAELPQLVALAAKVHGVHSGRHPELAEVKLLVDTIAADLIPHMTREDRVLFPAIAALGAGPASFGFGTIANPIAAMTAEHETVGELLARLREVTGGYRAPDDGCASYRLLYNRLATLEADTHLHVLKENSVLFPAAQALEAAYTGAGQPLAD